MAAITFELYREKGCRVRKQKVSVDNLTRQLAAFWHQLGQWNDLDGQPYPFSFLATSVFQRGPEEYQGNAIQ